MIEPAFVQLMARYNSWQNISLFGAADGLTDVARREDRGAFFGSIHRTLSHLMWADETWMSRFAGLPPPGAPNSASADLYPDWEALRARRIAMDAAIQNWADALTAAWLGGDLTWRSGTIGAEATRPRALLVAHFLNHQTHHRGQVHAMLTAAGARPEPTDLMILR